jgi:hypothetical protein
MFKPGAVVLVLGLVGLPAMSGAVELVPADTDASQVTDNQVAEGEQPAATMKGQPAPVAVEATEDKISRSCDGRCEAGSEEMPRLAKTVYLFGNLAYNRYRMDDVNQFVSGQNETNHLTLGDISSGGGSNFGGGFWLTNHLALGFEIGSLYASTTSRNNGFRETLNLPAVESGLFAKVGKRFWNHLILSAGGGIYGLNLEGASLVDRNRALAPYDYSVTRIYGYTFSTKAFGSAEIMLAPHVGLGVDVGYRWAEIQNQKIHLDGDRSSALLNPDGSKMNIDYSGLFVNTGLRFYFH